MADKIEDAYGEDYLFWKNWGEKSFGSVDPRETRYFDKIYVATKIEVSAEKLQMLELGFGNGSFLRYGVNKGWQAKGSEVNPHLVEMGKKEGFDVMHASDVSALSENSLDLVVAFDVLEHIPQEDTLVFLLSIKRLLKESGALVMRFPNGDSPFSLPFQNGDVTHVNYIGGQKALYYLNRLDLKKVYIGPDIELLLERSVLGSVRRLLSLCFRHLIELFVKLVFYRGKGFTAKNMLVIAKK